MRYMFGAKVPLVIRGSSGVGLFAAQHTNSVESWFAATPGPRRGDAGDARRRRRAARDGAARRRSGDLPHAQAAVVGARRGRRCRSSRSRSARPRSRARARDVTLITYSFTRAPGARGRRGGRGRDGISVEVIDLRTVAPLDRDTINESVRKTGRVVLLSDAPTVGGVLSEVAAGIQEIGARLPRRADRAARRPARPDPALAAALRGARPVARRASRRPCATSSGWPSDARLRDGRRHLRRPVARERRRRPAARSCAIAALDTPEDVARETADADGDHHHRRIRSTAEHIAALGPRVRVIGRAGIGLDAIDLARPPRRPASRSSTSPTTPRTRSRRTRWRCCWRCTARLVEADRLARLPWGDAGVAASGMRAARDAHARARRPRPHRPRDGRAHAAAGRHDPGLRPGCAAAARRRRAAATASTSCWSRATSSRCTCRCCPQTEKLFGPAQFERMRPGALLVNVSRGGLIDEDALADALADGTDRRRGARRLRDASRWPPTRRILTAPQHACSRRTSPGSRRRRGRGCAATRSRP